MDHGIPLPEALCFMLDVELTSHCGLKGLCFSDYICISDILYQLTDHVSSPTGFACCLGHPQATLREAPGGVPSTGHAHPSPPALHMTLTFLSFKRPALRAGHSPFQTPFISFTYLHILKPLINWFTYLQSVSPLDQTP